MPTVRYGYTETPIGTVLLVAKDDALTGLYFDDPSDTRRIRDDWVRDDDHFVEARRQLNEYFNGERTTFDLPFALEGTAFQKQVWAALCEIGYGETMSYGELAERIGRPNAARAVGRANGTNPVSIIVPCHRVIGSNGSLVGYGWGTDRKSWLLKLENVLLA